MDLLLKLTFLEGVQRKINIYHNLPPVKIFVFSKRLTMTKAGEPSRNGGMIAYAWYLWDFTKKDYKPYIDWI